LVGFNCFIVQCLMQKQENDTEDKDTKLHCATVQGRHRCLSIVAGRRMVNEYKSICNQTQVVLINHSQWSKERILILNIDNFLSRLPVLIEMHTIFQNIFVLNWQDTVQLDR
jgi:hypothetical protein